MTPDLTLVIYLDELIDGSREHKIVQSVTKSHKTFNAFGNKYQICEYVSEVFSKGESWPQDIRRDKVTIKANKLRPIKQEK